MGQKQRQMHGRIFIYNILMQRRIVYLSSVIAVCGTTAFLVRDIMVLKQEK